MEAGKPSYEELVELVAQQAEIIRELRQQRVEQQALVVELKARVAELEEQLQAAHRQTAPFRRREQLKKPDAAKKTPGRPAGHAGSFRQRPEQIDQAIEVPLTGCPQCQGELTEVRQRVQFIEEIPPIQPIRVKLTTWTGVCARCGEVHSTHPLQTSTAIGAAGTHLGPRAQGLALLLSHRAGLTMGRTCQTLKDLLGLRLSRGGLAQLLQRAAGRLQPFYQQIVQRIRDSDAVFADETSWYVGSPKWWLWIFTTPQATLYRVEPGRGANVVEETLGSDFSGMLVTDCLASYNSINCRKHKCIAHHLRVLKEHEAALEKQGVESQDLLLWKVLLKDVINTWKQRQREELTDVEYALKVLQLQRGVENLLSRAPPEPQALAFRNRLARQRDHLLGCLQDPAAEPTNNRAERDLRPAVIDRKLSCGNKTIAGKSAWEIVRSVITTLCKQHPPTTNSQPSNLLASLLPYLRLAPH